MRTGIFIWTVANDYGARIPDDDSQGAMSVALFKVLDGMNEMQSPQQATALAKTYRDQGIDFLPWGVVRGFTVAGARAEGALAGQYAAITGSPYIVDLEPDPKDYWQGIPGTAQAFVAGYNSTAQGQSLRLCPDARTSSAGANGERINLKEWVAAVPDAIWHPQAYYTDFGMDMQTGVMTAIRPLLNAGIAQSQIYPVLPFYSTSAGNPSLPAQEISQAIDLVSSWGYPGIAWWRRGLMSPEQVSMLLAKKDPFMPEPQPPTQTPKQIALAHLEAARIAVEGLP